MTINILINADGSQDAHRVDNHHLQSKQEQDVLSLRGKRDIDHFRVYLYSNGDDKTKLHGKYQAISRLQ